MKERGILFLILSRGVKVLTRTLKCLVSRATPSNPQTMRERTKLWAGTTMHRTISCIIIIFDRLCFLRRII